MTVAAIAANVALLIGGAIGLIAGFYGGLIDNGLMRLVDILMAFPYQLLAIALVAALGPGLLNALIAIALANVSFYARGVRAATLVVRRMAFIEAARALGPARYLPAHRSDSSAPTSGCGPDRRLSQPNEEASA